MLSGNANDNLKMQGWLMHSAGLGCLCVLMVLIFSFIYRPLNVQLDRNRGLQNSVMKFINSSRHINREHERLTTELTRQQESWSTVLTKIPEYPQEANYLAQVTQLAEKSQLQISNFSPGASHDTETLKERDVRILLSGRYESICHFLDGMKKLSRISNIQQLSIGASSDPKQINVCSVILSIRIAYDYRDQESL